MKYVFLFCIFFNCYFTFSQKSISTNGNCTNEMTFKAKGRWAKMVDLGTTSSPEAYKRLEAIQNLLFTMYPEPVGVDAAWRRNIVMSYFGAKHQYSNSKKGPSDFLNLPHFFSILLFLRILRLLLL